MLKFFNYDIVFQEIPDEVTLAVNITNCPNRCPGCHSQFLWADIGEVLNEEAVQVIIGEYGDAITCFSFMGGDNDPQEVERLALWIKHHYPQYKIAWYTGKEEIDERVHPQSFDYIKIGPYIEACGGLKSQSTNQRLLRILSDGTSEDTTYRFWEGR